MLQWCKHLFKTMDHRAGKPIKNEYNKQHKTQHTSSGDIYAGRTCSINFWKGDFSTSPQTPCPFNNCCCCSFYLLNTKRKSTWSTSAPYCCCSFPVPTSFPVFQDSVDTLVYPGSAPPSATKRPYPCSSPALAQCMFYSHQGSSDCCLNSPGQRLRCHSGFYAEEPFLVNASHVCGSVKLFHTALCPGNGQGEWDGAASQAAGCQPQESSLSFGAAVWGFLKSHFRNGSFDLSHVKVACKRGWQTT